MIFTSGTSTGRSRLVHLAFFAALAACVLLVVWGSPAHAAFTRPLTGVSFGPSGKAAGEFTSAVGVAVDQKDGDVLVYDGSNGGNVYKFDASGEPVSFSSLGTNEIEGAGAVNSSEGEIAVDSSSGPAAGDVYVANNSVVRIYSAAGEFLGEITGGETCGVAVDSSGAVYVGAYPASVTKYVPVSNPVSDADETTSMHGLSNICNVAVDQVGDVYAATYTGGVARYEALQFGSLEATGTTIDEQGRTLTIDSSGSVYANSGSSIAEYDSTGTLQSKSGEGELSKSFGVAVNDATGSVYAPLAGRVAAFGAAVVVPDATTEAAGAILNTGATLNGSVNPDGTPTTYQFEYGTEETYGSVAPASPASVGFDSVVHTVSAHLEGLIPDTVYHYRLLASNPNGTTRSTDMTFRTTGPPQVLGETFSEVGATGARLSSSVNDFGHAGAYHYEYGTSGSYGSSTTPASLGASEESVSAGALLSDLQPDTTYHFRVAVEGPYGTALGPDVTFTTLAPAASALPDDRSYELVTPVNKENANVYLRQGIELSYTGSDLPLQASPDGSRITYAADPTVGGNGKGGGGGGNVYLASRSEAGWKSVNTQPPGDNTVAYQVFNEDLSIGFMDSCAKTPLSPLAPAGYDDLYEYLAGVGSYVPLITSTPPNRSKGTLGAAGVYGLNSNTCPQVAYAGSSADGAHVYFEANDALTPQAAAAPPSEEQNDLYDSVAGQLSVVNVLPSGAVDPGASFGSRPTEVAPFNFHRAISSDGSRAFWTDLKDGNLYVREDDGASAPRTVQVDAAVGGGGYFWSASRTGSVAFFTKEGSLYAFDADDGQTADLAAAADVLGVVDASDDGSYVYFVAEADLAGGASIGQPNLYLIRREAGGWGPPVFVATLSANDVTNGLIDKEGIWIARLGGKTAEATSDGHSLVFESHQQLSDYDNAGSSEVYVYDADSGQIACPSCKRSGEAPSPQEFMLPLSGDSEYQSRWISSNGSKVFFNTIAPLVPNDVNGRMDVYEWERQDSGGCGQARGCVSLLSGGTSSVGSYLAEIGANGDDVFIVTRARLLEVDQNENADLYDVRAGAVRPVSPSACTGSGCQGVPPAPPFFATPSSVTFNGVGNLPPAAKARAKLKSKPLTKAQRLAKALKACAKKPKRGRARCKRLARQRYGTHQKSKKVKSKTKGAKRHA